MKPDELERKRKWEEKISPVICGYLLVALLLVSTFGTMLAVHDYRAKHRDALMLEAEFKVNK